MLPEPTPCAPATKPDILLVDDDAVSLEVYVAALQINGYHPTVVDSAKAGLEHLRTCGASLLITDINMEEMDGLELITKARKLVPGLRIIAMSGGGVFLPEVCLKIADKLGASATLYKPFSMVQLLTAVRDALGASSKAA